ncbi:MAG: TonB family protein [Acidobacteriia bacterium]|nr:TonB family protein [Terriglobia bacterium]
MFGSVWSPEYFLVIVALKGSLVLSAAWLVSLLLRRRSAALRHVVWVSAFAALLALPLLTLSLPVLRMPVAPALLPAGVVFHAAASASPDAPAAAVHPPVSPSAPAEPLPWYLNSARPIVWLWFMGALAALGQMLASWLTLWRVRRRAPAFPVGDLGPLAPPLPAVDILQTPSGSMPMAFGLFRPAVFLPADAVQWSPERRRLVLLHELAHVSRGDLATHLLARVAWCLYWWNPLAWTSWRRFLKERERAADDRVLAAGALPSDYAGHLLDIARAMRLSASLESAALAMARGSQLEGRLLAILDSSVNRRAPSRASVALAALAAVALVAPFAALQAQPQSATLPADVDATIRAAVSQHNHDMLESAAKAAEVLLQYDTARTLLDSSLAIREQSSGQQSVDYGTGLLKIGDLERSRGNSKEAEAFYTKAVSVLGTRPEAVPALLNLGTAAWHNKDTGLAMDYFQKAQVADPTHAGPATMWMAVMQDRQNLPDEAEALFKSALALEAPNSAEAAVTMELYGFFLNRQKRQDEAKSVADQAAAVRKSLGAQVAVRRASITTAVRVGNGVTAPALLTKVEPQYTEEARLAKYQGTVIVSVDIDANGVAQNMRVVRGLGLGLDEQALKAIAQWTFKPGTQNGQPVPVMATIEVNFRLL